MWGRVEGVLGFLPTRRARGRPQAARGLRVWKSIPADYLLCVCLLPAHGGHTGPSRCFQLAMPPGPPWGLARLPHSGCWRGLPRRLPLSPQPSPPLLRTFCTPPRPPATNRFELAGQGPEQAHRCVLLCSVFFCVVLFNPSWQLDSGGFPGELWILVCLEQIRRSCNTGSALPPAAKIGPC